MGRPVAIVGPTSEPVTEVQALEYLRDTENSQTEVVKVMIGTARRYIESYLRRALISTQFRWRLDHFPHSEDFNLVEFIHAGHFFDQPTGVIRLPRNPVISVDLIDYIDTAGDTQSITVASETIVDLDSEPARVTPLFGETWPSTQHRIDAVTITFTAGFGTTADAVPDDIKSAILLFVADLYEHREGRLDAPRVEDNPTIETLLWNQRILEA